MELRQYWRIVWRRIWIPALVLGVVLVASLVGRRTAPSQYQASARVLVDVPPLQAEQGMGFDPRLTAPQATEYLVDDFSVFVGGQAVAQEVSQRLADQGIQVPAGVIQSSTASQKIHRVVVVQVTWPDPDQALTILSATIEVLRQEAPAYFGRLGTLQPQVTLFDGPSVSVLPASLSERLDLPVRLLLAVLAGLAVCFVLDYLDDSVRDGAELEGMGIRVLTEVPARRNWAGRNQLSPKKMGF
jgi:capsular polysaccharide biosynthesis protein